MKLLTKQCKADKWKRTCKDIDLRKEGHKPWRLLHNLNEKTPKQRRQPLKTDDALVTDSRKKAKQFNKHFASTNTLQSNPRIDAGMILIHEDDAVVWCGLACRKRHSGQATQAGHCGASRSSAVDHCEFSQERSLCCGLGGIHSGMDH